MKRRKRHWPTVRVPVEKRAKTTRPAEGQPAGKEIEIKLRVADKRAMLRRLAALHARQQGPRVHEMNALYDTPDGTLARRGQMLRIRIERPAGWAGKTVKRALGNDARQTAILTYKGPASSQSKGRAHGPPAYKVREEREVFITDAAGIAGILEALGLHPWFRYEKHRSTYLLPVVNGVKVELDETPIGNFLELEGRCEAIDRSAKLLGFGPEDYITRSYGSLYLEQSRKPVYEVQSEPSPTSGLGDMFFPRPK
jgi:adenylate cyclase class IV